MVFSSALEFTGHPLSVRLALPPSLSLPFPPSPSAVTEQTGQVINSGATTLNLSCRQRFSFPPLLWCDLQCPSRAGISKNTAPQKGDSKVTGLVSLPCPEPLLM